MSATTRFWLGLAAIAVVASLASAGALFCAVLDAQNGVPGTLAASIVLLVLTIAALMKGVLVLRSRFGDSRSGVFIGWLLALGAGAALVWTAIEVIV